MASVETSLGGYTIEQAVARGRSGTVYRALSGDGSVVALKVFERRADATREAACLGQLDHHGLATLIAADLSARESPWLALEWIDATTLSQLLSRHGPLSLDRVRTIVDQIAAGLDALHHVGFVHGDLSPSNILVDAQDKVTVVDFASAHLIGDVNDEPDETTDVKIETTPRYASPEVALGRAPTTASDVYALGIIAYEALTGRAPYPSVATPIAMLGHHASSVPDPPSEHRPDLPASVEVALLKALAKEPDERPVTPTSFADQLRSNLTQPVIDQANDRPRPSKRAITGGVVVLFVAVGLLWLLRASTDDTAVTPNEFQVAASDQQQVLGPDATAGSAGALACNLITTPGFEPADIPASYYGQDPTNTVALAAGAGVSGSAALRVGANGTFGLFGEIVPIDGEGEFVLSAYIRAQGDPDVTTMYVDYLDADYQLILSARETALAHPVGTSAGQRFQIRTRAPDGAAFAVPSFLKDSTGGSLLIDEVVFGSVSRCGVSGS